MSSIFVNYSAKMVLEIQSTEQLRKNLKGELYTDALQTGIYATDASNYQMKPMAVAVPKDAEDVRQIIDWASKYKIPVMARGGGTSLVGQTVTDGLVIDFTKYMNQILEVNTTQSWAIVQPGIVRDVLNQQLAAQALHFAPDPATTSRATIGGMIANNSSGTRSIMYGKTIDHVLELEVLLADGTIIQCKNLNAGELESKLEENSNEGEIYRKLFSIVQSNRQEIIDRFPKVMRRVGGYNLDEFLESDWNLAKLFTGSECTLGIILSAKIKLEPTPKFQALCIVHFKDFFDSISHVAEMVKFSPSAVELLDDMVIRLSRENIDTQRYCDFIDGDPGGALIVEFYGETREQAAQKASELAMHLQEQRIGYSWPVITDKQKIQSVFTLRQKGLGLLMGVKGNRKPIAFIEDAAVPLESLSDYIREVFEVCKKYNVHVVAYAHASVGLLHVKPLLDLRLQEDIERMKSISDEVLQLVIKYKGSWSGEHGDGLARSPYNERFFGTQLYNAFKEVKKLFDPAGILNPGKIVEAPEVDLNLRYGKDYRDHNYTSMFHYRSEGNFHDAVHLCNGVGECRKHTGGTMCPSYRATKNEKDTTRGRANILRLAMSGQLDDYGLESPVLQDVMDLCLSCKACKSECPSNVDMAKLKSEVLHAFHKKNGMTMADRLILANEFIAKVSHSISPKWVNGMLRNSLFRLLLEKMAGLDRRRILPEYATKKLPEFPNHFSGNGNKKIVLFADTYIKYYEPGIGISAKNLLESMGYDVVVFSQSCCQRQAISHGLLDHAKSAGEKTLQLLEPYFKEEIPVVVCEPSCATALQDDLPDLMEDPKWQNYADGIYLLEDFITKEIAQNKGNHSIRFQPGRYLLHGHCHQKAIFTTQSIHQLFSGDKDSDCSEIQSGCCGMAGTFGYEKNHYEISETIANTSLIPAIKAASEDVRLIASGFSCRHQIEHFTSRKARHWVEYVDLVNAVDAVKQ
jgi:FAD/FMN-containing dehydrogenase/Fe-S oxidoreductase